MSSGASQENTFSSLSMERRVAELTILYEVSRALQRTVDEERALQIILLGITSGRGLGFGRAFILLADSDAGFLQGRLAFGPSSPEEASRIWQEVRERRRTLAEILESLDLPSLKGDLRVNDIVRRVRTPIPDGESSLIKIMKSREAGLARNGLIEPHGLPVEPSLVETLGIDTFAVAPLFLAGKDIGLIIADNALTRADIDTTGLRLLQIYAQAASAAIENTRLYGELMEKVAAGEQVNLNLRESQHHLLRAERLSTIGKMAALLAHEIRTPLVSIGGFARRMLRSAPQDDPRREEMEIIVSEVRRLEKLVDEVLGYSRMSRLEYQSTNVNEVVRSVMIAMHGELEINSVRLQLDLDPDLTEAVIDEAQIRQALMNLVTNAIEAMPSGGTLTLSTSVEGRYFEVGVADTGVGIAEENWDKLYAPFFTTKSAGTGLGLAIVSQVIENHKGSLRFESLPGKGTSFRMRLALRPEDAVLPDSPPSGKSAC